jgi:nitroreductase
METLEAIYKRRSIRQFTDQTVSNEQIENLLKAAFSAPTAANTQPWEFVVLTEKEILDKLKEQLIFARYNAPAAIVVCGNMKLAFKGPDKDLWISDCSAAVENILLAATDIGLGSVWIGVYPLDCKIKPVRKILDMPDYVVPLAMIYIGHSTQELEGRCRYNDKRIYWQKYDPNRKHKAKDKPVIGHYS